MFCELDIACSKAIACCCRVALQPEKSTFYVGILVEDFGMNNCISPTYEGGALIHKGNERGRVVYAHNVPARVIDILLGWAAKWAGAC